LREKRWSSLVKSQSGIKNNFYKGIYLIVLNQAVKKIESLIKKLLLTKYPEKSKDSAINQAKEIADALEIFSKIIYRQFKNKK
jgi:hypothetical protein